MSDDMGQLVFLIIKLAWIILSHTLNSVQHIFIFGMFKIDNTKETN